MINCLFHKKLLFRKFFSTLNSDLKFALLLSGCGVYDGSEITEAVACLISLAKNKIKYQCFSLDSQQTDSVNHLNGSPMNDKRNMLVESARIARGDVKDIKDLNVKDYDAIVVPGGFGAAKSFSNFALVGEHFTVHKEIESVLQKFHAHKKPIAACCISPLLLAQTFGKSKAGPGIKVTLGKDNESEWPYAATIKFAEKYGNTVEKCDVTSVSIDEENKIVTTPAYMKNTTAYEVFVGIDKMISETVKIVKH